MNYNDHECPRYVVTEYGLYLNMGARHLAMGARHLAILLTDSRVKTWIDVYGICAKI